jgi:hypothetical protein
MTKEEALHRLKQYPEWKQYEELLFDWRDRAATICTRKQYNIEEIRFEQGKIEVLTSILQFKLYKDD